MYILVEQRILLINTYNKNNVLISRVQYICQPEQIDKLLKPTQVLPYKLQPHKNIYIPEKKAYIQQVEWPHRNYCNNVKNMNKHQEREYQIYSC